VAILRAIVGAGLVACLAAGIVAPAIGAAEKAARHSRLVTSRRLDLLMSFTPASADPRLAAYLERSGVDAASFRFTPAQPRRVGGGVSVTLRARDSRVSYQPPRLPRSAGGPALEPIAYSIGGSVNWKRLAIGGDVGHLDLAGMPGSRDSTSASIGYAGKRLSGRVKAESDRPTAGAPRLDELRSYTVDVGGSYALTHNLDVTAGLRYRSDRAERLETSDPTRESRAVYVGTAFRF
jgi:hypothetical protein